MRSARKKYTLVEVTIVMTIIAVALSLTLVAINNIVAAQKLNTGVARLENAIKKARNAAVAEQTYVALLLPYNDKTSGTGKDLKSLAKMGGYPCRSFRLCEVTTQDDHYQFVRWLPNQNWEQLPDGVVIAGVKELSNHKDPYRNTDENYQNTEYELTRKRDNSVAYEEIVGVGSYFSDSGDWEAFYVEDVPTEEEDYSSSTLNTVDCAGIVFNKFGNALNTAGATFLIAEGQVVGKDKDSDEPHFRFAKSYYGTDSKEYLSNWAELRLETFTGMPYSRLQYQPWGLEERVEKEN